MKGLFDFVLLAGVLLTFGRSADEARLLSTRPLRFLVTPKTLTSTLTVPATQTSTVGTTTSCVRTASQLTSCRKRRSIVEVPLILEMDDSEEIDPSAPIEVMFTAYPEMWSMEITDSTPTMDVQPSIDNTASMAEVQISDMESICNARLADPFFGVGLAQVFGVTVLYSTTVTSTQAVTVTTTTVAKVNTITLDGCLPDPLPFSICT